MRSLRTELALLLAVLMSGAALGACIIGPKQDDPESSLVADTGTVRGEDAIGAVSDTSGPPAADDGGPKGDASGDACGDGCVNDGAPLGDAGDGGGEVSPDALGGD